MGWWSGQWGEWEVPHGNFHSTNKIAADAGVATALWEAAEENSINGSHICEDVDIAVGEVFGCYFDVPFCWASCNEHYATLVFEGDAVKVFFFVVGASDEDGVGVFDGIFKDGLADVDDVITAVAWSVGV